MVQHFAIPQGAGNLTHSLICLDPKGMRRLLKEGLVKQYGQSSAYK